MLSRTMTYTDYDGNVRTETFYFNLSKAEIAEKELSLEGGLVKTLETLSAKQDGKRIVAIFKELVLEAYGEKSMDGKRFIKTQELRDAFAQTEAYSDLFVELATNTDAAIEFVKGIVPQIPAK